MNPFRMHGIDARFSATGDDASNASETELVIRDVDSVETRDEPGTLEASVVSGDERLLTVESFPNGRWMVSWPSLMSVDIDEGLRKAAIRREADIDPEYESILLNPLVGAVAMLRGSLVLHASAVETDGVATLVVGHSGAGKTSTTAMLCAGGARLISEDVCALSTSAAGDTTVFRGMTDLRLRQTSESLINLFAHRPQRLSVDGRCVVSPEAVSADEIPIGRIAVVMLDRSATTCSIQSVEANVALTSIMRSLRFPPEARSSLLLRSFDGTADLVAKVEVVTARIPWGMPITADLASEVTGMVPARTRK
jgi:hypothetical protein